MSGKRKICVVTGSRAEYGMLYWVIGGLDKSRAVELQLVVTGQHLAREFGYTVDAIESDGFKIKERVEMLVAGDTSVAVTKSVGLGLIGFSDCFARLRPDVVLLLGDRFEIFAAAQAALIAGIPIAHVAGGDTTEGAFDEAIRHCISKMSHVHFVTNEMSAKRLRLMGERPDCIHVVGSPGLDSVRRLKLLSRKALERELGVRLLRRNILVTYHPVTLEVSDSLRQLNELLAALESLAEPCGIFFTLPNSDPSGRELAERTRRWVEDRPNAHIFASLGQLRYLSLMAAVDAVVGNSSSGLYEAPSFGIPTINIGDRQRGRLAADSVIHCKPSRTAILAAFDSARQLDCSKTVNPYGDGHSSERIVATLERLKDARALLMKRFHVASEASSVAQ